MNFQPRIVLYLNIIFHLTIFSADLKAEPWLSNRYAQNCAACHSPSRRNVEPIERRCTLACQGCHESPSGGGLRNAYGVFNQKRWLSSFNSEWLMKKMGKKARPAPLPLQKYSKQPKILSAKQKQSAEKFHKNGFQMVTQLSAEYNEDDYDRSDNQEKIVVQSQGEFLTRVTESDPWREIREQEFSFGGDFRYAYFTEVRGATEATHFPMALQFGGRYKPTAFHNFTTVLEAQFGNRPGREDFTNAVTSEANIKSAYFILNDLPYATYVMYGVYRPLFGYYTPDHESLLSRMLEFDMNYTAHALSFGGSPNVPFANVHIILPKSDSTIASEEKGIAANLGGRFVTMGASVMLSYWKTEDKQSRIKTERFDKDLLSLNAGGVIPILSKNLIVNIDYTTFKIGSFDSQSSSYLSDNGTIITYDTKLQLWRENYISFGYADANVGYSGLTQYRRKKGKSSEMYLGIKSFPIAGTELEILSVMRDEKNELNSASTAKYNYIQAQLHLFW